MRWMIPCLALALGACKAEGDDHQVSRATVCLEVASSIELGEQLVGAGALLGALDVTNRCDHEVEIRDAFLSGPLELGTPLPLVVGKRDTTSLEVAFEPPTHGNFEGELSLLSTDAGASILFTTFTGTGLAPEIEAMGSLDVRSMPGCDGFDSLSIRNQGNIDLEVYEIELPDPALEADPAPPYTIAPGDTLEVHVQLSSLEPVELSSSLGLLSNDPLSPEVELPIEVLAEATAHQQEFSADRSQVDVLFTLDRSCSNIDEIDRLFAEPGALVDALLASGVDAQLSVVSTDDRCIVGDLPYLDPAAADADADLEEMLALDTPVSDDLGERGFEMALSALWEPCNKGIRRSGARLAVVHVSDEDDNSSMYSVPEYLDSLMSTAPSSDTQVHAIAGPFPSGCDGADPGKRLQEAVDGSGGQMLPICAEDPGALYADLAAGLAQPDDTYTLAHPAVEESIAVYVDSALQDASDWIYDPASHTVALTWSPPAGSTVRIEYVELIGC